MEFIKKYLPLILLIILYSSVILSVIDFGIPNSDHPFTYHMDEWHQLMAVRALFKHGSSNVEGAANGPIFFFFIAGMYLIPFYLLKIIDPFAIKSAVTTLVAQQHLFEVLRLNSLMFGIGSIVLVWQITKKYLKSNPIITTIFFVLNPIWIMLSNYFKYDIALSFFILLSLYMLYYFSENPTRKRFILAAMPIGCSLAIKISAMPLIISFVLAYFLFTPIIKRNIRDVFYGLFFIIFTFCIVGIPDVFMHAPAYYDFFYSNLVDTPNQSGNFILGMRVWIYIPFHVFPLLFGHALYGFFWVSFFYFVYFFRVKKRIKTNKEVFILFFTFIVFSLSLIPLKIYATGNRVLVLLPFIALFSGLFWQKYYKGKSKLIKSLFMSIFVCIVIFQSFETYAWIQMKYGESPNKQASLWMIHNLPKQTLGIENIPIYQGIPDVSLKEFYTLQKNPQEKTYFTYEVIDNTVPHLPKSIIITNVEYDTTTIFKSSKKLLLKRLKKEGYKEIRRFNPSWYYFQYFGTSTDLAITGLVPLVPISIYQKL